MSEMLVCGVLVTVGWLFGWNAAVIRYRDDAAISARISQAARAVRFKRRFLTGSVYPTWEAEFVTQGESYLIEVRCAEDRGKRPLQCVVEEQP